MKTKSNKVVRKISVKALIVKNKKILLLKPYKLQGSIRGWDGPGGHVEQNEPLLEALKREVFEETNLKIKGAIPIKVLAIPQRNINYIIFLCTVEKGKVTLSKEHVAFKWVTLNSLKNMTKVNLKGELILIKRMVEKLIKYD